MRSPPARDRYLLFTVFLSGMTVLAVEMGASRLLAPYFGTSLIIWANLIGLMLIYLSVGYYLGGWLADRFPRPSVLYQLILWAGFAIGWVPHLAQPILRFSALGLLDYSLDILLGSLLAILALFLVPVVLLGCVSPFAIRLQAASLLSTGQTAGGIYALSTLGSILGTFVPVLVTIPALGTQATFLLFALASMLAALGGLYRCIGRRALLYAPLPLLIALLGLLFPARVIRAAPGLLHEAESPYNYIQVVREGEELLLYLNEGQAVHSTYNPNRVLSYGIWDYFLLAPYFNHAVAPPDVSNLLLIGLGAGTVAKEYTAVYGSIPITGVEIDPAIIQVGHDYFAMREPNLRAIAADGRQYLSRTKERWDVIAVDAYRQPYIPFHLTTVEFFQLARDHLTPRGVLAINAGRTLHDDRLVQVLASTMADVFSDVYIIDALSQANSLVVGTNQDTELSDFAQNLERLTHPALREVASWTQGRVRRWEGHGAVYTDDRAPVEHLIHLIALRYILEGE